MLLFFLEFVVVHNGIITNYKELKQLLVRSSVFGNLPKLSQQVFFLLLFLLNLTKW